jgi:hypothetical protein
LEGCVELTAARRLAAPWRPGELREQAEDAEASKEADLGER